MQLISCLLVFVLASTACGAKWEKGGSSGNPGAPSSGASSGGTTSPNPVPTPAPSTTNAEQVLASCTVSNSPKDIASWPITTTITKIIMRSSGDPNAGLEFFFDKRTSWPNYTPPGWTGPLNYTVWAGVKIGTTWHCSGIIQFWSSRVSTGAPILQYWRDWAYDARWGQMMNYYPVAGDEMIFCVSAGDARGNGGVTSVRERSNCVTVKLPAGDTGTFTFAGNSLISTSLFAEPSQVLDQTTIEYNRKMLEEVERHGGK